MLPYAAYLRVYESLAAFAEPARSRWAGYAMSAHRPERSSALEAEHAEAMRRLIAVPPIIAPPHESEHAYVRQVDGVVYICPYQTRLRSWLALGRLRATLPPALTDTFVPRQLADHAAAEFARWHSRSPSIRTHVLTSTWHVPLAWFVPFAPPERWLVLGRREHGSGPAPARTMVYVTTMAQARRRVARSAGAVRRALSPGSRPYGDDVSPAGGGMGGGIGDVTDGPYGGVPRRSRGRHAARQHGDEAGDRAGSRDTSARGTSRDASARGNPPRSRGPAERGTGRGDTAGPGPDDTDASRPGLAGTPLPAAVSEIEEIGRWLEEFHPRSLVELDYGGLVHLMDDEALRGDQSVAEVAAAITGLETGELELAVAMYQRLRNRWRPMRGAEFAN